MNEWSAKKPNCKSAIFFFARGSTELGNVGAIIGPGVFSALKMMYSDIAIQGVEYGAGLMTNMMPGGAEPAGIAKAKELFNAAASACPNSMLVGGGYSQGAALMHRAIESLPQATKDKIVAVVLYGDTQNLQDGGKIKNFPKEKVKVFCNMSDGVCGGMLLVNIGHLSYTTDYANGAKFVSEKLKAAKDSTKGSA
ncbi:cutinase [Tothia fuscella]|uniref:Cutinase n=1 Tax=Tothia fuscella TaxID=1048955 RepID=A0A9P4NDV5_9PEZI|nr:cutinase [Tothia fuscella]